MTKDLASFWGQQKSLTEWLEDIGHKDAVVIRREDNDKRERLKVLNKVIGLPYDRPAQFEAQELADKSPALRKFLDGHGNELCALRLMPKADGLPKLRMRGKTIKETYQWFLEQKIDASMYRADFVPHVEQTDFATIFVVNKHGIQGEITRGGHHELTQGFHEKFTPHVFRFDYKKWSVDPADNKILEHLKKLASYLKVADAAKRAELHKKLGSTFTRDYLEGYFESTHSKKAGTWFIDYSPSLGKIYSKMIVRTKSSNASVVGQTGSPGKAKGPVCIVQPDKIDSDFPQGGILVCSVTTPNYVPLMQRAAAIVTDQGGILSHAAIVARELKVPCIVSTGNATQVLKSGQVVSVDANLGVVSLA